MGTIYKNGVPYSGGGGSEKELTYNEYQELSEEEKSNGTTYYITDGEDIGAGLDTTLTKRGRAADAKAVGDKIKTVENRLIASDNTPFRFGVTEDGKYGYIITDEAGADTVIPFKSGEGSAEDLYDALKYSGLVTEDMTYAEMLEALRKEYPQYIEWSALSLAKEDWTHTVEGSKYGSWSVTQNESIKVSAGGDYTYGATTRTLTSTNSYDLSKYKNLKLKGTATWSSDENYSAWGRSAKIFIIDADSSENLVEYNTEFVSAGTNKYTATINEDINLPDLTGINCKLKIVVHGFANNGQGTTSLTINKFVFYSENKESS